MSKVLIQGPSETSGKEKSVLVEGVGPGVGVDVGERPMLTGVRNAGVEVTVGVTVMVGVVVMVGVTVVVVEGAGVGVALTTSLNSIRISVLSSTFMNAG